MVRALGMGLLSVPVITMSLSTLKAQEIGQGAAFTGMLRQLGGSFGVALISTFLSRWTSAHRQNMISHLSVNDWNVQQRLAQFTELMRSKGMDMVNSQKAAYQMLENAASREATLLSYMDVFLWVGIVFLVFVPLVLLLTKPAKNKVNLADAAH